MWHGSPVIYRTDGPAGPFRRTARSGHPVVTTAHGRRTWHPSCGAGRTHPVIGIMNEPRSRRLSRDDVFEALMWALEHDVVAFDEHRTASRTATDELARARAHRRLWRRYRAGATHGRSRG